MGIEVWDVHFVDFEENEETSWKEKHDENIGRKGHEAFIVQPESWTPAFNTQINFVQDEFGVEILRSDDHVDHKADQQNQQNKVVFLRDWWLIYFRISPHTNVEVQGIGTRCQDVEDLRSSCEEKYPNVEK